MFFPINGFLIFVLLPNVPRLLDRACTHIVADYVVGNEKMKHLLTSLGFQETGFIEENNEVAMRLDLKKEE